MAQKNPITSTSVIAVPGGIAFVLSMLYGPVVDHIFSRLPAFEYVNDHTNARCMVVHFSNN
jgi:hypothetical protein